jgi:hypothetical protein
MYPVEVLHPTKTYLPGLKNQLQWFLLLKVEVMEVVEVVEFDYQVNIKKKHNETFKILIQKIERTPNFLHWNKR